MNLKEYLPYYLGCGYWTNNSQGQLNSETLPNVIDMVERNAGVQLWLRPLATIQKDEIHELLCCIYGSLASDIGNISLHTAGVSYTAGGVRFNNLWTQLSPIEFHYLIRKGFDLFGLIAAGVAVDVTKIQQS